MVKILAQRRKLCAVDQRPISPERLQLVGVRKAKTCGPTCAEERRRQLRAASAARSRERAKDKAN